MANEQFTKITDYMENDALNWNSLYWAFKVFREENQHDNYTLCPFFRLRKFHFENRAKLCDDDIVFFIFWIANLIVIVIINV